MIRSTSPEGLPPPLQTGPAREPRGGTQAPQMPRASHARPAPHRAIAAALAAAALIWCALDLASGPPETIDSAAALHGRAQALQAEGRTAESFAHFARAADCGHRDAARHALKLRAASRSSEPAAVAAGPQQLARWQRLAAGPDRGETIACPAPAEADPLAGVQID